MNTTQIELRCRVKTQIRYDFIPDESEASFDIVAQQQELTLFSIQYEIISDLGLYMIPY